jgi:hypothetical protein
MLSTVSFSLAAPLLEQEGWTRPKENAAKHPLNGADGVVAHRNPVGMLSERLFVSDTPALRATPSCSSLFQEGSFRAIGFVNLDSSVAKEGNMRQLAQLCSLREHGL